MRLASPEGISRRDSWALGWFRLRKRIYQRFRFPQDRPQQVLFVAGCQRSGTSMVHHLFRRDWASATFDEVSPLSLVFRGSRVSFAALEQGQIDPYFRWKPLAEVQALIEAERAPLVVAKPLVEAQNLTALLDHFPRSRAIWMFRPFPDVVQSSLKYFRDGNGERDLAPILAHDQENWRAQHMAEKDVQALRDHYRPGIDPRDAAALFWYARNSLFFSRGYHQDDRIRLCRYDDLVTRPGQVMREAYGFIGRPYPGDRIVAEVFASSLGRGQGLEISPGVAGLCRTLLERLEEQPRLGRPTAS